MSLTDGRVMRWSFGRLQFSATKYVHRGRLTDRHVWQWSVIYDRKRKTSDDHERTY